MEAIGAAQDFEGRGMVNPEGESKSMGGVGTSVPTSEAARKPQGRRNGMAGAANQWAATQAREYSERQDNPMRVASGAETRRSADSRSKGLGGARQDRWLSSTNYSASAG